VFLLTLLLLPVSQARAGDVRGTLTTTVRAEEVVRNGEGVPLGSLYEQLALEWADIAVPGFSDVRLVVNGWGALRISDDPYDEHDGDLGLLFLEGRTGPLRLRLGRQHIALGPGRMQLVDGVQADIFAPYGLRAQGYFGASVNPRFDYDTGDWQAGGRLAVHVARPTEIGVGYAEVRRSGERIRQEIVADLGVYFDPVRVLGWGAFAPRETLTEARGDITVALGDEAGLTLLAHYQRPDLLLARDSIFWVFGADSRLRYGLDFEIDPSHYFSTGLEGSLLTHGGELDGYEIRARAVTYREPTHRSLIGLEAGRHEWDSEGYVLGRAFTRLQVKAPWRVVGDLHFYHFDEPINGESISLLGTAGVVWDVAEAIQLAATTTAGATPREKWTVSGMLRFAYGYQVDLGREVGP